MKTYKWPSCMFGSHNQRSVEIRLCSNERAAHYWVATSSEMRRRAFPYLSDEEITDSIIKRMPKILEDYLRLRPAEDQTMSAEKGIVSPEICQRCEYKLRL